MRWSARLKASINSARAWDENAPKRQLGSGDKNRDHLMVALGIIVFYAVPLAVVAAVAWAVGLEYRKDRIPILLYHRLISKDRADRNEIADDEMIWVCYDTEFAKQMNYLKEAGYQTLSLDEFVAIRSGDMPLPAKPIVITFDDGYESNYQYAFPALKANDQKATIFVAPEPDEHTRSLVAGIDGFLTGEQMRELSDNGVDIQSHTLTHCILTEISPEQARYELSESRKRIHAITQKPVNHIAIPRAGYNRRVRRLVREEGYLTACGNRKGSSNGASDRWALPRIVIERDMTLDDFRQAISPRGSAMLRIIGNIKRIPERLGGATFAMRVRNLLYDGPLGRLCETRNLKRMLVALAGLYVVCSIAFTWRLLK